MNLYISYFTNVITLKIEKDISNFELKFVPYQWVFKDKNVLFNFTTLFRNTHLSQMKICVLVFY